MKSTALNGFCFRNCITVATSTAATTGMTNKMSVSTHSPDSLR